MKLKVISDGTVGGTKLVTDDEKQEAIEHVTSIHWSIKANGFAYLYVGIVNVPAELVGELVEVISVDDAHYWEKSGKIEKPVKDK